MTLRTPEISLKSSHVVQENASKSLSGWFKSNLWRNFVKKPRKKRQSNGSQPTVEFCPTLFSPCLGIRKMSKNNKTLPKDVHPMQVTGPMQVKNDKSCSGPTRAKSSVGGPFTTNANTLPPRKSTNVPWKGTILKGKFIWTNHQFSGDMLVFRGVNLRRDPRTDCANYIRSNSEQIVALFSIKIHFYTSILFYHLGIHPNPRPQESQFLFEARGTCLQTKAPGQFVRRCWRTAQRRHKWHLNVFATNGSPMSSCLPFLP